MKPSIKKSNAVISYNAFNSRPVIKLSLSGILLYANDAGIDLIRILNTITGTPAIRFIIDRFPSILDPECESDFELRAKNQNYSFSAIAFPEAGYVGLYFMPVSHINEMLN